MSQAVSPALGCADGFGPLRKLVLDAVPSPLTRVMYARALDDFFAWWTGQGRPPFTRATVQAWRAALEAKGLASASVNQKLSALRKLAAEALQPACSIRRRRRVAGFSEDVERRKEACHEVVLLFGLARFRP